MIYPTDFINKVICGDCLEVMKQLPNNSIDCIITSPPYFNSAHKYQRGKGYHYTQDIGEPLFVIVDTGVEAKRILKQGGVYCLNLGYSYGETGVMRPFDIIDRIRKQSGLFVVDVIIWHKNNPIPLKNRLTNAFEYIFVLSNEPVVKYYTDKYEHNVWCFPVGNNPEHSAVFPDELPLRLIKTFTKQDDIVLDIFNGSGTTNIVSLKNKRKFIGIELNEEYCKIAEDRLRQEVLF